jgi:hypothetical protein
MKILVKPAVLSLLLLGLVPVAAPEAQPQRDEAGNPTGLVRGRDGVLRSAGVGFEVKFACSPQSVIGTDEMDATYLGAPPCREGLAATEWFCVPNPMVGHEDSEVPSIGAPSCDKGYTPLRQKLPSLAKK